MTGVIKPNISLFRVTQETRVHLLYVRGFRLALYAACLYAILQKLLPVGAAKFPPASGETRQCCQVIFSRGLQNTYKFPRDLCEGLPGPLVHMNKLFLGPLLHSCISSVVSFSLFALLYCITKDMRAQFPLTMQCQSKISSYQSSHTPVCVPEPEFWDWLDLSGVKKWS